MAANFLEQLIAEWYEYEGYFLRRNILVGKRPRGGYDCEIDLVAFHPSKKHLIQVEPSMDTDSWAKRNERYKRKFDAGKKYIPNLFSGFDLPDEIDQIALLVYASKKNNPTLGGGKVILIGELLEEIFTKLKTRRLAVSAIPEHMAILRSFQFVSEYKDVIEKVWQSSS
jgi:hypothetical protein